MVRWTSKSYQKWQPLQELYMVPETQNWEDLGDQGPHKRLGCSHVH